MNPARLVCESLQRAIGFGGRKSMQTYQLYQPIELRAWLTLHQLFALAEDQELEDLPVPEPLTGGNTVKETYLQALLKACRDNGHPVVHVTTAYQITDRESPNSDMGMWHHKIPVEVVNLEDKELWAIDGRIAPIDGE